MTTWPASSRYLFSSRNMVGPYSGLDYLRIQNPSYRRAIFSRFPKTCGFLEYYAPHGTYVIPYVAGAMGSWKNEVAATVGGSLTMVKAKTMAMDGTISLTGSVNMGMYVTMICSEQIVSMSESIAIGLALQMQCTYTGSFTGSTLLSVTVPVAGSATITLSGSLNLKGLSSMQCEWTPYTDLSPQNLAAAVLAAAQDAPIHANVRKINSYDVIGNGTAGDLWRGE